jgi:hypothetical protein
MDFTWTFTVAFRDGAHAGDHLVRVAPGKRLQDLVLPLGKTVYATAASGTVERILGQDVTGAGHRGIG